MNGYRTASDVLAQVRETWRELLALQVAHGEVCSTCNLPVEIELCGHAVAA